MRKIILGKDAREKLLKGSTTLANAVKCTMGAAGRNVVISDMGGERITKDGVTVAKDVMGDDDIEDVGVSILRRVATKTAHEVGDATSTSVVLAQAILEKGIEYMNTGSNSTALKKGIDLATRQVVEELKKMSQPVSDTYEVAMISTNGDEDISKAVVEAFKHVGNNSPIVVKEARGPKTTVELSKGARYDRGYASTYQINDYSKNQCILQKPYILIYGNVLHDLIPIEKLLNQVIKDQRSIVIIVDDISEKALSSLVLNGTNKTLQNVVIKAPGFGDLKRYIMDDIAALTGATVISEEKGHRLSEADTSYLGSCMEIVVGAEETSIIGGAGDIKNVEDRINVINDLIEITEGEFDLDRLNDRLTQLSGKSAIIHVGAYSEIEYGEKKDRAEDAVCAVRAALEEGIVVGGGATLVKIATKLMDSSFLKDQSERNGYDTLINALFKPFECILNNGGIDDTHQFIQSICQNNNRGFDIKKGKVVDMIKAGIVDPTKVERVALENAASIAGTLLTVECIINK